jgi:hypothetical protein
MINFFKNLFAKNIPAPQPTTVKEMIAVEKTEPAVPTKLLSTKKPVAKKPVAKKPVATAAKKTTAKKK